MEIVTRCRRNVSVISRRLNVVALGDVVFLLGDAFSSADAGAGDTPRCVRRVFA